MDSRMPSLLVLHCLLEFAQIDVHGVDDAIYLPHLISSVTLFFCLQSFPASGSFPISRLFASHGQSTAASASASVIPVNTQGCFPSGLAALISLQSKGLSRVFSNTTIWKHQLFGTQPAFFMIQFSHLYMTTGKAIALTIRIFFGKVMSLHFNMLSRFVLAFLLRSKYLLIPWLQSPSTVILEPKKIKSVTASTFSPSSCHDMMEPNTMIFVFWMLSFKPTFSLSSFTLIKMLFSSSSLSAVRVILAVYLRLLIFLPAVLTPACDLFNPAFHMMYSACKLNTQGDNIQPCHTPFPILNQSVVPCKVLTVASWPTYMFLR